jgi:hypothetical protein
MVRKAEKSFELQLTSFKSRRADGINSNPTPRTRKAYKSQSYFEGRRFMSQLKTGREKKFSFSSFALFSLPMKRPTSTGDHNLLYSVYQFKYHFPSESPS